MIQNNEKAVGDIDLPLAFRTKTGTAHTGWNALTDSVNVCRVEARAIGGHQKEALVSEGDQGHCWRMLSDEGPILGGTDLAPFPLGFFSAGLQGDLLGRIHALSSPLGVKLDALNVQVVSRYAFSGSFFAGTGQGSTQAVEVKLRIQSQSSPEAVANLFRAAVNASPAFGALRQPMTNTFALYVNGKRAAVEGVESCTQPDQLDPFLSHRQSPVPERLETHLPDLIKRLNSPDVTSSHMPSDIKKFEIVVGGSGQNDPVTGTARTLTWLQQPLGTPFELVSDLEPRPMKAPTALSYMAAAVSFCYMTQLLRYIDYQKLQVRAVRLIQINPFIMRTSPGSLGPQGQTGPFETHLYLNGNEPDEVMQKLLFYSARTCYLHAALSTPFEPILQMSLNGSDFVPVD